jgi:bifunctional non-homologous end joining protein LigD
MTKADPRRTSGKRKSAEVGADRPPVLRQPMLATLVDKPFDAPGWVFEEKYDGDRLLAYKNGGRVRLLSRAGKDRTTKYPDLAAAIAALPAKSLVLDGEVVVFDRDGVSRFQMLQKQTGRPVYAAFDCLYRNGEDLRQLPLSDRRKALQASVRPGKALRLSRRLDANGIKAFRQAKSKGFEGLVAKQLSAPYVEGRSPFWRKVKVHQEDEFVVVGFTPPAGKRHYFGALLLGAHHKGKLHYVGRVGTGFDRQRLSALHRKFRSLITDHSSLAERPPGRRLTFLKPRLVAQISYQEITGDGKLRQPVFLGLRDDKRAADVEMPVPG